MTNCKEPLRYSTLPAGSVLTSGLYLSYVGNVFAFSSETKLDGFLVFKIGASLTGGEAKSLTLYSFEALCTAHFIFKFFQLMSFSGEPAH
jgi:hypothetical protein